MADQTFAVHCGFFDAIDSDRVYSADEMNRPYRRIISNGVFATPQGDPSTDLQVVESTGMNIICKAGEGLFGDKWFENPSSIVITVPNNTSTVPRIDSVLVQVDTRTSGRVGNIVYRTGTPASSPTPPAINGTEGVVEYRLANIRVNAGVTSIMGRYITDRRGSSDCPWVTSLIYQVDTSTLYDQWQAAYAEYFETEKAIWDAWYEQLTEDLDVSMTLDRHVNTVTTDAQTTGYIPIGLSYNHNTDILEVYINGLRAVEGTHYVVVDDTKILVENQLQIGQTVTFVVMKSVIGGNATSIMAILQTLEEKIAGIAGGTPTVVDSTSAMTDTEKIYILSSDSKWYYYSTTQEDWVIGGVYGGVPTDPTLTQEGMAADSKAVGDAIGSVNTSIGTLNSSISEVENALNSITQRSDIETEYNESSSIFTTQQGYIDSAGTVRSTSSTAHGIWYFQTNNDLDVYLTDLLSTANKYRLTIYEGTPLVSSGLVKTYQNEGTYPLPVSSSSPAHVEAGQYIAVSIYNQTDASKKGFTLVCITEGGEIMLASDLSLTDTMTDEVESLIGTSATTAAQETVEDTLSNLYANDGWYNLPASDFALNAWTSYATTDNRTFRVRCTKDLIFDRDVFIRAKAGYALAGFYSDDTGISATEIIDLPANTAVHLYIRRHSENTSETADISEFADAMLISTPFADMERLLPTFTDISMFERVGIGGDSYAGGGGIISGIRSLTWGKNLERQAGITVDIYAKSGQDVMGWNSDTTNGLPALLSGTECGLYWLAHGINGTSTPELLGTSADMSTSPRPNTFYGQYAEAIEQIKTAFPDARIVIQTIIGSNYGLYQYHYNLVNQAIRDIAEYCQIPVIDVTDDEFYLSPYYSDNMRSQHPTAMVAAGMAMANRRLLSKCILANPAYFVEYGSN